jgi:anti-sigma factor RsiW
MKNTNTENVYKLLDDNLTDAERARLSKLVQGDPESAALLRELQAIRTTIAQTQSAAFGAAFTDSIMAKLDIETMPVPDLMKIFRPVAAAAIAMITLMFGYSSYTNDGLSLTAVLAVPETYLEDEYNPIDDYYQELRYEEQQ